MANAVVTFTSPGENFGSNPGQLQSQVDVLVSKKCWLGSFLSVFNGSVLDQADYLRVSPALAASIVFHVSEFSPAARRLSAPGSILSPLAMSRVVSAFEACVRQILDEDDEVDSTNWPHILNGAKEAYVGGENILIEEDFIPAEEY